VLGEPSSTRKLRDPQWHPAAFSVAGATDQSIDPWARKPALRTRQDVFDWIAPERRSWYEDQLNANVCRVPHDRFYLMDGDLVRE
jgi:hypothetical protein